MRTNGIFVPSQAGPESHRPTCDECGKPVDGVHVIRTADEVPRLKLCPEHCLALFDELLFILRKVEPRRRK